MIGGGLLMAAAAVRLSSEVGDGDEPVADSGELCAGVPCRANADPRPVRGYEAPSIVVDPADVRHQVVVDANLIGNRCSWHVTFDGGLTWEDGDFTIPPEFTRCEMNSNGFLAVGNAAMGSGGNVYAVLSTARVVPPGQEQPGESVLLVSSTDGGRTFSPAREILPGQDRTRAYVRPALSVAPSTGGGPDRLLVSVWGCGDGRCEEGWFLRSDDGGATFGAPVLMTPDPGGNSPSRPVLAADGSVYMTFLRRYGDRTAEVLVARSGDDGRTFDSGVVDKQNNLGGRYETAVIRVDPSRGWVYMVFTDTRDGPSRVFFRRSKDQGRTWERVVRLSEGSGRSYNPAMSVAPDGRIDVVYYRRGPNESDDVYATWSSDGGTEFAEAEKVNDQPIDRRIGYRNEVGEFYTPEVASTATTAHFVWSDTRNGTPVTNSQETFTRRLDRTAPAVAG